MSYASHFDATLDKQGIEKDGGRVGTQHARIDLMEWDILNEGYPREN